MSTSTFDSILVPVASEDDARVTSRALREHLDLSGTAVTFVFVVEKGGGVPDKASVEQREAVAEDAFEAARAELPDAEVDAEIVYDTDVADGIRTAADKVNADTVVFVPRREGRFVRFLTGDVTLSLVTESDRPVVTLPSPEVDG